MTEYQENKLDKYFQEKMLEKYNHFSILGGKAVLIHHFKQGRYNSIRWYTKNAIPLTLKQHNEIHNDKGEEYENYIISLKGGAWNIDLIKQKFTPAKDLSYEKVILHIDGYLDNYI